jgi:hypothetical protein
MRDRRTPSWLGHGVLVAALSAGAICLNTRLDAPPRFDGAGYAVLAASLASGQGYREIDHPDRPVHAHFPPGYPLVLAAVWRVFGRSAAAAHLLSGGCTLTATVLAWAWFRQLYSQRIALVLGVALAVNWTWARNGGEIQSEPLFLLLGQAAILFAGSNAVPLTPSLSQRNRGPENWFLGALLAGSIITRQVGLCLALAVVTELALRGKRRAAIMVAAVTALMVLPWALWLGTVRRSTQLGLFPRSGLATTIAENSLFYVRRIPDMVTGPIVEVATVFRPALGVPATGWAIAATAVVVWGWCRIIGSRRLRLAGLVPICTLTLLLAWPFTEAGRFLVPLVPLILIGAVEGLGRLLACLPRMRRPRAWAALALLAVSIPYSGYAIATSRAEAGRRTHDAFDAACAWIATHGSAPGPILTRHPGEMFWQTGRRAVAPTSENPAAIAALIERYHVAYLLVDAERYARAPASPLVRFAETHRDLVFPVWGKAAGVTVYAVTAPRE